MNRPIGRPVAGAQLTLVFFPLSFIKELHHSPQLPFKEEKRACFLCCEVQIFLKFQELGTGKNWPNRWSSWWEQGETDQGGN